MRVYTIWLAGSLLWAQLVWDWHAEQDQGDGYHIPVISSLVHSQIFHRVKLVGDTLWVMGNTCVRPMDTLYLPSADGAKEVLKNLSGNNVAVSYIAGYDRITGELKIAYLAHVTPSESYDIRFQDFAVSENQDTIWIAVDLPNGGGCRSRPSSGTISIDDTRLRVEVWSGGSASPLTWQSTFIYQLDRAASAGQVWQITRGGGVRCVPIYWQNNQYDPGLSLGFWSLVRQPGVVYVSGTCRRPNTSPSQSPNGYFSSSEMNNAFPLRGSQEPAYGFILRLRTGNSFDITHAAAIGQEPGPSTFQTYGRSLILYGDTVFFLIGVRSDGGNWNGSTLYAKNNLGAPQTLNLSGLSGGSLRGRVLLVGFRAGDLAPVPLSGPLTFARLWDYDGSGLPQPPTLYPVVVEDTLYIAWSDRRQVEVPRAASSPATYSAQPRIYVMGWSGLRAYGTGWTPFSAPNWPATRVFLSPSPVSGMVRWGDTLWVSCAMGSWNLSPLLLLNRRTGQFLSFSTAPLEGYFSSDTVEIGGLALDSWGHLYAAGVARGDYLYTQVRPDAGPDSVTLSRPHNVGGFGYGRSWVGRLLNYRYRSTSSVILNRCVPDSIQSSAFSYVLWGHFSPGEKIVFTWEGGSLTGGEYGYLWRPGAIYTVSADRPDSLHVTLSWVAFPGSGNGTYTLRPRLLAWWQPDALRRESGPSSAVSASGYTLPSLYRVDSTERWWVVPFLGDKSRNDGWRSLGPSFHRRQGYIDGNASLDPHYAFAYVPYHPVRQEEGVYVAVNYTDSVLLYWLSMNTGMVYRERGWPRLADHQPVHEVHPDTIVGGIQQLHYSPFYGHLFAVEGAYRLRGIPLSDFSHPRLTYRERIENFGGTTYIYTQLPSLRSQPGVLTSDNTGRIYYWTRERETDIISGNSFLFNTLLSYRVPAVSGVVLEAIHQVGPMLACMNEDPSSYTLASIRAMVLVEDTLFLLDWGPYRTGLTTCNSDSVLCLRKMILGSPATVQTLDTLYNAGSVSFLDSFRLGLLYRPLPAPHLLIAVPMYEASGGVRRDYILRYWLDGRASPLDTVFGSGSSTGCAYGLDKLVSLSWPKNISFEQTRSGMLLFSAEREIRAALPLYINRDRQIDRTTWQTDAAIQVAQVIYTPRPVNPQSSGSQLSWSADSLGRAGQDSLRIQVTICGGSVTERHQTVQRFFRLPQFLLLNITSPNPVCQGEIFHAGVGFGGDEFLLWQNYSSGSPEACAGMALLDSLTLTVEPAGKAVELLRIRAEDPIQNAIFPLTIRYYAADSCQGCVVRAAVQGLRRAEDTLFFRAFLGALSRQRSLRIRRGHQLRLRVAMEGPALRALSGQQRLAPHPLLNRLNIARSTEWEAPPLADSLWILPASSGGNIDRWRRIEGHPLTPDTTTQPQAWRHPVWASPCRIELREGSPDGPVADRLWGLIDTAGWVWPLMPPMVDSTDAPSHPLRQYYRGRLLSFCQCDTTTPKWIVIRFPNHIALRSAGPLSLTNGLLSNDPDQPAVIDFTDPTYLDGIPGYHYAVVPNSLNPGFSQAAAWAGNIDDCYAPHWAQYGGQDPPDCSRINAADWEMLLPRNGIISGVYTIADLDGDGDVDALDATLLISNMNALREGTVGD